MHALFELLKLTVGRNTAPAMFAEVERVILLAVAVAAVEPQPASSCTTFSCPRQRIESTQPPWLRRIWLAIRLTRGSQGYQNRPAPPAAAAGR